MMIKVKVFPASKSDKIIKKAENSFVVQVREKPKMGQANKAVVRMLADYFKIPESKIRLIKGFKEPNKIFEINI